MGTRPRRGIAFRDRARLASSLGKAYYGFMLAAAEIEKMSVAERLQAIEQLWDALCRQGGDLDSPAWHRDVLTHRRARAERGEAKFLTLDQLRSRLRE